MAFSIRATVGGKAQTIRKYDTIGEAIEWLKNHKARRPVGGSVGELAAELLGNPSARVKLYDGAKIMRLHQLKAHGIV